MDKDSIPKVTEEVEEKPEDKFVSKRAYQEVSADMHTYKKEMKSLQAEVEKMRADESSRLEAEQVKNGEFQKLADSYKQKFEEADAARQAEKEQVVNFHKLHSVENAIGGFQRSEYAKMAVNLDAIKVDENGIIDEESLKLETSRIRQEHPSLLKTTDKPRLPNLAPGEKPNLSYTQAIKECKTMNELRALIEKNGRAQTLLIGA